MTKKRVISLTVLIVLGLVAIAAAVLGFVKVNNQPKVAVPDQINVSLSNGKGYTVRKDDTGTDKARYDELIKKYDSMFDITILTGIFTGRLGGYEIVEYSQPLTVSGNVITFSYDEEQILKDKNGNDRYSDYDTSQKFRYKSISFSISEDDKFSELKIFISLVNGGATANENFYAEIQTMANTSILYNALGDYYIGKDS